LGITVCKSSKFVCSWTQTKRKCFYTSNVIFSKLGNSTAANVILKLVFTHGVQNLLYGIAALSLTSAEVDSLAYAYNSIFCKIFKLYDKKDYCHVSVLLWVFRHEKAL